MCRTEPPTKQDPMEETEYGRTGGERTIKSESIEDIQGLEMKGKYQNTEKSSREVRMGGREDGGEEIRKSSIIVSRCSSSRGVASEKPKQQMEISPPAGGRKKGIWYGEIIGRVGKKEFG